MPAFNNMESATTETGAHPTLSASGSGVGKIARSYSEKFRLIKTVDGMKTTKEQPWKTFVNAVDSASIDTSSDVRINQQSVLCSP